MASLFLIALLGLTGQVFSAPSLKTPTRQAPSDSTSSGNVTLAPVVLVTDTDDFTPSVNATLPYGSDSAYIDLGLTSLYGNILLETLSSVVSVSCAADSVSIVFDSAANLEAAFAAWSPYTHLLFITNHMGDCDSELERGFFTADGYTTDESSLTLTASAEKSDISSSASYIRTSLSGLPYLLSDNTSKRSVGDITYSPDPINFNTSLVVNETDLYSNDVLTASIESGDLTISITVGATIVYNVLKSELEELEVYLETNTTSSLVLELDIGAATNETFAYNFDAGSTVVEIPGVLSFGPSIEFSVGAAVEADAGVEVELILGSEIYNGSVTLDYTGNLSYSGSWDPTFSVGVNVSEAAGVSVTPFVESVFDLSFSFLNGTKEAAGGIAPRSSFPTSIQLDAEEDIGSGKGQTPVVTQKGNGACENGVEVDSDFLFSLDAYVTGKWDDEYFFNVTIPVLDECFSW